MDDDVVMSFVDEHDESDTAQDEQAQASDENNNDEDIDMSDDSDSAHSEETDTAVDDSVEEEPLTFDSTPPGQTHSYDLGLTTRGLNGVTLETNGKGVARQIGRLYERVRWDRAAVRRAASLVCNLKIRSTKEPWMTVHDQHEKAELISREFSRPNERAGALQRSITRLELHLTQAADESSARTLQRMLAIRQTELEGMRELLRALRAKAAEVKTIRRRVLRFVEKVYASRGQKMPWTRLPWCFVLDIHRDDVDTQMDVSPSWISGFLVQAPAFHISIENFDQTAKARRTLMQGLGYQMVSLLQEQRKENFC